MKLFIRRILWLILIVICSYPLQAQENKTVFNIKLKNESVMQITVCSPEIFRIRVSAGKDFPQSLMERYGILKTDWGTVTVSSKNETGNRVIQTNNYQLTVNETTGDISVKDAFHGLSPHA